MRFGADSTNYYEVISPIFPGWEGGRSGWDGNKVDVDLIEISQLKAIYESPTAAEEDPRYRHVYLVVDARGAPLDGKRFVREDELSALRVAGFDPEVPGICP